MEDVTRPDKQRGQLRPPQRASVAVPPRERTLYTRRTRLIGEMVEVTEAFVIQELPEPVAKPTPAPVSEPVFEEVTSVVPEPVIEEQLPEQPSENSKPEQDRRRSLRRIGLILIAGVVILITGYVTVDTIVANNRVKENASKQPAQQETGALVKADEGSDETKPVEDVLTNYNVAPSLPRALYINSIGVSSRVLPMSINTDGSVQAPRNIFDAGWYNGSVKPGEPGAVFIDGHASGATRAGLFAYLDKLKVGDQLQIEKGDRSTINYKVVHTQVLKLSDVDMEEVLAPYDGVTRGLNLMTCTGEWVEDKQTYDQRVIVWAEQV